MFNLYRWLKIGLIISMVPATMAFGQNRNCAINPDNCCAGNMGGISYCDTSASRFVCQNSEYSTCYCSRHAVMDLQKIAGCCLWNGGVVKIDPKTGDVICRDGSASEICGLENPPTSIVTAW